MPRVYAEFMVQFNPDSDRSNRRFVFDWTFDAMHPEEWDQQLGMVKRKVQTLIEEHSADRIRLALHEAAGEVLDGMSYTLDQVADAIDGIKQTSDRDACYKILRDLAISTAFEDFDTDLEDPFDMQTRLTDFSEALDDEVTADRIAELVDALPQKVQEPLFEHLTPEQNKALHTIRQDRMLRGPVRPKKQPRPVEDFVRPMSCIDAEVGEG